VPTNFPALRTFHHRVTHFWLRTLRRRSQKDRTTWQRIAKIASDYLPHPKTLHPWPHMRFAVTHPRWEPRA
jgi:RNA-directed DNA polymerase